MTAESLPELLDFASEIAWQAGRITLAYYQTGVTADLKADESPVTIADRSAEEYLRSVIAARFSHHAILGEEYGETNAGASHRWIVDPIDGTRSFIRGVPLYGVLIGLEREGQAVLGAVCLPALGELVTAAIGEGCYSNGRRAYVSTCSRLSDALLTTSDATMTEQHRRAAYRRLVAATGLQRTWGDCYGYVMVATGRAEIMVDALMNVWDCAALLPIVQEAGGTFTDWNGTATIHGGNAIATNGILFDQVMELVREP